MRAVQNVVLPAPAGPITKSPNFDILLDVGVPALKI